MRHAVDIMAINETWLRAGEEGRAPAVPGYRLRHRPRPPDVRSRGGGVGFYVRDGLTIHVLKHPEVLDTHQRHTYRITNHIDTIMILSLV
ncbi:unnamed protein product [Colias eurytheme]|nr:unnamed protein product [Colias eurytheme]